MDLLAGAGYVSGQAEPNLTELRVGIHRLDALRRALRLPKRRRWGDETADSEREVIDKIKAVCVECLCTADSGSVLRWDGKHYNIAITAELVPTE